MSGFRTMLLSADIGREHKLRPIEMIRDTRNLFPYYHGSVLATVYTRNIGVSAEISCADF